MQSIGNECAREGGRVGRSATNLVRTIGLLALGASSVAAGCSNAIGEPGTSQAAAASSKSTAGGGATNAAGNSSGAESNGGNARGSGGTIGGAGAIAGAAAAADVGSSSTGAGGADATGGMTGIDDRAFAGMSGGMSGNAGNGTLGGAVGSGGVAIGGATAGAGVSTLGGALAQAGNGGAATGGSIATGGSVPAAGTGGTVAAGAIVEACEVSTVFSAFPVGFSLVTSGNRQFAAFYDANRAMTVVSRSLGSCAWLRVGMNTSIGWDSHNYIAMALDSDGYIHLAGNMHASALVYFRTTSPYDITTFQKQTVMVTAAQELQCTYPQFLRLPSGELAFIYRSGSSGSGDTYFNRYSTSTRTWSRLVDTALLDGETLRNAYPVGPIQGPDNYWHLVWVWRETSDATTNHDLSYARSLDLVNWQKASGQTLVPPITLAKSDIVDPVPQDGGMINNNTKIGFDAEHRPIVAYHKFDASGYTQLYNARFENGAWVIHQTSNWTYRWAFGGTGTLVFQIEVEPVVLQPDGTLTQNWYHAQYGGLGAFRLNPTTLAAEATIPRPVPFPMSLATVQSTTANMQVRWQKDSGASPDPTTMYLLRWETLPSNRDQAVSPIPPAAPLRLYGFSVGGQ